MHLMLSGITQVGIKTQEIYTDDPCCAITLSANHSTELCDHRVKQLSVLWPTYKSVIPKITSDLTKLNF